VEYNSQYLLDEFITSIIGYVDNIFLTIIDNASNYSVSDLIKTKYSNKTNVEINVIRFEENLGYGKAINRVALDSDSDFLAICNSDLVFFSDTFKNIQKFIELNPNTHLFGGQQYYPDGSLQYSYGDVPSLKMVLKYLFFITQISNKLRNLFIKNRNNDITKAVSYLDGAFFIIKTHLFKKLNGFDEDYYFYSEDADLCFRAKKLGYKSIFTNIFKLQHHRGGSTEINLNSERKTELIVIGIKTFIKKHYNPFYQKTFLFLYKIHIILSIFVNKIINFFSKEKSLKNKILNLKLILKIL
jgi:GT2 family glycosyltransferase